MPEQSPHDQMMQMITGYWVTQIVRGAADASLAERLGEGPRSAADIAADGAVHPDVAFRFLRACAALGLVTPAPDGRFAATPLLDTLREEAPGSLRGMALAQGAPGHWLPWGRFTDVLATGRRQTIEALGAEVFDYYAANPRESADFSRAMSNMTAMVAPEVVRVLDTSTATQVVDIGGAEGALLGALLGANPQLRGVVFDRPDVVPSARGAIDRAGLGDRVDIVGGDFFADVPAGDLYVLKFILHDWDDDSCLKILHTCRRAAKPGGRVAIIELALGDVGEPGLAPLLDLNMMALASGRERTVAEYGTLLEAAGFGGARATPTQTPMVVIEGAAA